MAEAFQLRVMQSTDRACIFGESLDDNWRFRTVPRVEQDCCRACGEHEARIVEAADDHRLVDGEIRDDILHGNFDFLQDEALVDSTWAVFGGGDDLINVEVHTALCQV